MTIESQLPAGLQGPVAERLQAAAAEQVVRRIWDRDGTLWAPEGTPEVTDRLGWLDIAERLAPEARRPAGVRRRGARRPGSPTPCCSGMGGSSLGPEVLRRSFGDGAIRLHVLDSTHPDADPRDARRARPREDALHRLLEVRRHDRDDVAVQVLPLAAGRRRALRRRHRPRDVAREARRRARLPARVRERPGHRRALLGAVLLRARPGRDRRLRRRRRAGAPRRRRWRPARPSRTTPACGSAPPSASWRCSGRDKLTFVVDEPLESFGLWAEQLVAESTGKEGRGILPIADEPLVPAAEYGDDRVFLHVSTGDVEITGKVGRARRPPGTRSSRSTPTGPTTSAASSSSRSSPPRSPAGRSGSTRSTSPTSRRPRTTPSACSRRARPELDAGRPRRAARPRSRRRATWRSWPTCRTRARSRPAPRACRERVVARATTSRPPSATARASCTRPASSTRAGRAVGAFLQIVDEPQEDLEVPGEPYTFGTLIRAQADGDLQTLRSHGLDAVRAGREIL